MHLNPVWAFSSLLIQSRFAVLWQLFKMTICKNSPLPFLQLKKPPLDQKSHKHLAESANSYNTFCNFLKTCFLMMILQLKMKNHILYVYEHSNFYACIIIMMHNFTLWVEILSEGVFLILWILRLFKISASAALVIWCIYPSISEPVHQWFFQLLSSREH